jgi:hypothetical protein
MDCKNHKSHVYIGKGCSKPQGLMKNRYLKIKKEKSQIHLIFYQVKTVVSSRNFEI